jgi:hypothetical protein
MSAVPQVLGHSNQKTAKIKKTSGANKAKPSPEKLTKI